MTLKENNHGIESGDELEDQKILVLPSDNEPNCTTSVCDFEYLNESLVPDHQDTEENSFYYILLYFLAPGIFSVFTLVGIAGNGLVIYVIVSNPRMRSVTNLLLLNLAGADVAFLFFCGPFTAYKYYAQNWSFGDLPCQMVQYLLYVSAYVTIYTLVAISVHRYVIISKSSSTTSMAFRSKNNAVVFIFGLWLVVLVANIPTLTIHKIKEIEIYRYCGIEANSIKPLFLTFFVFGYAVPLSIICLLYVLIIRYLHSQKLGTLDQQHAKDRKSRTERVIVLVIVVFGIAWLPHHVNSLVAAFGSLPKVDFYEILRVVWNCMMYGNSCINPFIYNCVSEEFRTGFRQAIGCHCLRKQGKHRCQSIERRDETVETV